MVWQLARGVVILEDLQEAQAELRRMLINEKFGKASTKVVIGRVPKRH